MSTMLGRRRFLRGAAVGGAALLAGCSSSSAGTSTTSATSSSGPADVVLVHGAWHNSACWAKVLPLLWNMGHRALAIDLPGHGLTARFPASYLQPGQPGLDTELSPVRDVTLDMAAEAVITALRGIRGITSDRRPTILVGHSMGGTVITRAAQLAPDQIDHLVYLAAVAPTRLPTATQYLTLPEAGPSNPALYVGKAASTGASRINPRSTDPAYRELLRTTFYGDVPTEEFLSFGNALTPDQPAGFATGQVGATPDKWGSVPRTYIQTLQDHAIAPALQQLMIDDANRFTPGNKFQKVTIDSSHSPFASRPEELAKLLSAAG